RPLAAELGCPVSRGKRLRIITQTEKFPSDQHWEQNTLHESSDSGSNSRTDALVVRLRPAGRGAWLFSGSLRLSALAASASISYLPEALCQRRHLIRLRSRKGMTHTLSILPTMAVTARNRR